ncbi:MAG: hypothetical protein KKA62_04970 [Nanoarchaeota archaeon]|nr:hypothetical protein [Nanoarchaeota archaeon]MBU1977273.1 hypothetical protein [Nanoarchaeota archaeon]
MKSISDEKFQLLKVVQPGLSEIERRLFYFYPGREELMPLVIDEEERFWIGKKPLLSYPKEFADEVLGSAISNYLGSSSPAVDNIVIDNCPYILTEYLYPSRTANFKEMQDQKGLFLIPRLLAARIEYFGKETVQALPIDIHLLNFIIKKNERCQNELYQIDFSNGIPYHYEDIAGFLKKYRVSIDDPAINSQLEKLFKADLNELADSFLCRLKPAFIQEAEESKKLFLRNSQNIEKILESLKLFVEEPYI